MEAEKVKAYYDMITEMWKTFRPILEKYNKSEEYIKKANKEIVETAAKVNNPYGNILALVNQAELIRIGYGAEVILTMKFPDGKTKTLEVFNNDIN